MIWRSFQQYLSLIVPLITLLFGIESVTLIDRAVLMHEEIIGKNYAIVLVSSKKLNIDDIKPLVDESASLNELDSSSVLNEISTDFKDDISSDLKKALPYFYSLKLSIFPNQYQIKEIQRKISNLDSILRVEFFTKSHSQIYRVLVLVKSCVLVLSILLFILSILLMIKQIVVWRFEHSDRMEIMTYLGAPWKFKNAPLFKLALIDSVISSLFVIVMVFITQYNSKVSSVLNMLGIDIFEMKLLIGDFFLLLLSSFVISMITVFVVILFQKEP